MTWIWANFEDRDVINQNILHIKLRIWKIFEPKKIKIYFNISLVCCRGFSHLLSQQTFCANTIWRNFHSNLFQSPPNAQLTKSLVSMLGRRTWIKYCTNCKCCPVSLLIVRSQKFVFVFFFCKVMSSLITLIKCLKGRKSLELLCEDAL